MKVLSHSSVEIFISHGGWGSIAEVLSVALPMVLFPLDGDHQFGCRLVSQIGAGLCLAAQPKEKFSSSDVVRCLNTVADNTSFRSCALQIQAALFASAALWPHSASNAVKRYVTERKKRDQLPS